MNKMIVVSGGGTSESTVGEAKCNGRKGGLTPQVEKIGLGHSSHPCWEKGEGRENGQMGGGTGER